MKFGLIVALNALFIYSTAHVAHVQITTDTFGHTIQPLLALTTLFQHWVG